jgi:hypothetical protein
MAILAQLRVSDPNGRTSFDIVVSESTSMFNVHRVLQFCIKPRQADADIDSKVRFLKPIKCQLFLKCNSNYSLVVRVMAEQPGVSNSDAVTSFPTSSIGCSSWRSPVCAVQINHWTT